jgi:tRNA threonylcarbamoyl adenosine modification protein (Sua5/YciO/YrdC/YwlC family)
MVRYDIHRINPQARYLEAAANILINKDSVGIYPTDTVYGMGACATNPKALDKIATIIHKDKKRLFSFICSDFSQVSQYVKVSNRNYKLMKRYLPGPYTFILPATNYVPKKVCPRRKTVGIRIPDCKVCIDLVSLLGVPLANTSIVMPGICRGDPNNFNNAILNNIDVMIDIGTLEEPTSSTIVSLTGDEPELIRQGKGEWHG